MSEFTTPLIMEEDPKDYRKIILYRDLVYVSDIAGRIRIPRGFHSDLATIPFWARSVISVWGKHRRAAIVHDFLLSTRGIVPTSAMADAVFAEALDVLDVPGWKLWIMYHTVRTYGMIMRDW